jgi:hypothetical protein
MPVPWPKLYRSVKSAIDKPCPYCGAIMRIGPRKTWPSRDHILPRALGGSLRTKLIVCQRCNENKQDFTLREWYAVLKARGDPRAKHVALTIVALYGWLGEQAYARVVGPRRYSIARRENR